jgi:uncharacterized membrane protein
MRSMEKGGKIMLLLPVFTALAFVVVVVMIYEWFKYKDM